MKGELLKITTRVILFSGILLLMFIPLIQDTTHFKSWVKPLQGAFIPVADTSFTWDGWFNASFQKKKNEFIKNNFGLHNYYILLNNQLDFWLFKKAHAKNVIVGKENYLYETPYLDAYFGRDFIGKKQLDSLVSKLNEVNKILVKQNKLVMVVIAAGKASFYPEYIPSNYRSKKRLTNYQYLVEKIREKQINYIDFNPWFSSQKNKSLYPLYPQFGIHWSNYASTLAFDSILKYIEFKTKVDLPEYVLDEIAVSDSLLWSDNDILKAMNLIVEPKSFKMAYPVHHVEYDSTRHKKLKLLVVGDSFWWQLYGSGLTGKIFSSSRFWFYNTEMYPETYTKAKQVINSDYASAIKESDVIMLLYSEPNLSKFGNGFIEMMYETYFAPDKKSEQIINMKKKIISSAEWYNSIKQKAASSGLSVDSILTLNAIYAIEMDKTK